jgi:hypothetical protein
MSSTYITTSADGVAICPVLNSKLFDSVISWAVSDMLRVRRYRLGTHSWPLDIHIRSLEKHVIKLIPNAHAVFNMFVVEGRSLLPLCVKASMKIALQSS